MSLLTEYNDYFGQLQSLIKPILNPKVKNPEDLSHKRNQIIQTYNTYIEFAQTNYENFSEDNKETIASHIHSYRGKLFNVFLIWGIEFKFGSDLFSKIDDTYFEKTLTDDSISTEDHTKMAISAEEFLRAAAQQLPKTFNGDPLGLQAFLKSIKLLQTVAGTEHVDLLRDFIMTRLDSKASESVPVEPQSIEEIIESLKKSIKPDSSKVVAGKMIALKSEKSTNQEFAKQAEKLADDLKRSLIIEGISLIKATEMTTDKTIELCRSNAKSDLVKSILASTTFENPKEVLAKYIIESASQKNENQIFAFRSGRKFFRKRGDNKRGRSFYNRYNSGNRNTENNRYPYGNNYRRGRGRGRGYYNNNRGNSRFQNSDNQNIRYTENEEAPQEQRNLGDSN